MIQPPLYVSWIVQCESPDEARRLQRWLLPRIDLDHVHENVVRTFPAGVESSRVDCHRLGDYFASIQTFSAPSSPAVFHLLFQRRPGAGRFWKDLMVRTLQSLHDESPAATITVDYKGDCPLPPAEVVG